MRLAKLVRLVTSKDATKVEKLLTLADGNASEFVRLSDLAFKFKQQPKPANLPSPVSITPYTGGANIAHFLDHTLEYMNLASRVNKPSTSLWPPDTTPQQLVSHYNDAIRQLAGPPVIHVSPGTPQQITISGGITVQIGTQSAAGGLRVGQFFPYSYPNMVRLSQAETKAFADIITR